MFHDAANISKTTAKKAQRDAERRKERGKKRKHDEVDEHREQHTVKLDENIIPSSVGGAGGLGQESSVADSAVERTAAANAITRPKKRSKSSVQATPANGAANTTTNQANKTRFIVFVGNLPYSATDTSLHMHFKKLAPFTLRHRTDPKTKKSKGFAFLEFANYDRMKTCLKLYHHSMFDPQATSEPQLEDDDSRSKSMDRGRKSKGRRINVELTAGGGGSAEARQEKIKAKNVRLEEQRKRKAELERKERANSKKKTNGHPYALTPQTSESIDGSGTGGATDGIHPSRLARMK